MKQEDKELLLQDLCARLPYGVKMNHIADMENNPTTLVGIAKTMITLESPAGYGTSDIEDYIPYLFPLSSMTEEQLYELREMFGFEIEFFSGFIELSTFHHNHLGYLGMVSIFEWFNKNHFDYRRLIAKGLAIDCTNLNIY